MMTSLGFSFQAALVADAGLAGIGTTPSPG
jgi:hypothetical protein